MSVWCQSGEISALRVQALHWRPLNPTIAPLTSRLRCVPPGEQQPKMARSQFVRYNPVVPPCACELVGRPHSAYVGLAREKPVVRTCGAYPHYPVVGQGVGSQCSQAHRIANATHPNERAPQHNRAPLHGASPAPTPSLRQAPRNGELTKHDKRQTRQQRGSWPQAAIESPGRTDHATSSRAHQRRTQRGFINQDLRRTASVSPASTPSWGHNHVQPRPTKPTAALCDETTKPDTQPLGGHPHC